MEIGGMNNMSRSQNKNQEPHKIYGIYRDIMLKNHPTEAYTEDSKSFADFVKKEDCTSSIDQLEKPVNIKWNLDHKKWER